MQLRQSTYALQDGIATFTLNRPEARNALSAEMRLDFTDLVAEVDGNDDVKVLVVTGAGGVFCAGGDTKAMAAGLGDSMTRRRRIDDLHAWLERFYDLDCPVIAAVDGPAFGGGFSLALVCDFVLAANRARFCSVFGRIGLAPDMALALTLPRIVGMQRAKELMYTGRSIDAVEALDLGLVLSVHEPDALMDAAYDLAGRLAQGSKSAIAATKRLAQRGFSGDYRDMAEMEAGTQPMLFDTDFHREAIRRFAEKQPPLYDWDRMDRARAAE